MYEINQSIVLETVFQGVSLFQRCFDENEKKSKNLV